MLLLKHESAGRSRPWFPHPTRTPAVRFLMERTRICLLHDRHWLVTAVGDDKPYRSEGLAEVFDLHIIISVFQQACLSLVY
jgi:hypothetical protein